MSRLRSAWPAFGEDAAFGRLIDDLSAAPGFTDRWSSHAVDQKRDGAKRLVHPDVGELRLTYESMTLADGHQQLITWLPADEVTATALRSALAIDRPTSPAMLRVVDGA